MSTLDEKLETPRNTDGRARRSHAALLTARGYRVEMGKDAMVSVCPMTERTYWRHVGGGKWNSPGAEYEKVEA